MVWKTLNLQKSKRFIRQIQFKIDPADPSGISTAGAMPSK